METEVWRPVVGVESEYEVSNFGRVRSLGVYRTTKRGVTKFHRGRTLRPGPSSTGRLSVKVVGRGSQTVHKLVLEAFVGPCPAGMEALHDDDDYTNNNIANLSWGTHQKNMRDAFSTGTHPIGSQRKSAKLTEDQVREIIPLLGSVSLNEIGRRYGVGHCAIKQIRNGRCWRHVTQIGAPHHG